MPDLTSGLLGLMEKVSGPSAQIRRAGQFGWEPYTNQKLQVGDSLKTNSRGGGSIIELPGGRLKDVGPGSFIQVQDELKPDPRIRRVKKPPLSREKKAKPQAGQQPKPSTKLHQHQRARNRQADATILRNQLRKNREVTPRPDAFSAEIGRANRERFLGNSELGNLLTDLLLNAVDR